MKKYNAMAQDANNNLVQIFVEVDEATLNEFLNDYCDIDQRNLDPWDKNYRWLKDYELPEYGIPYRAHGWIIRFCEV